jgi:hypothetical protein
MYILRNNNTALMMCLLRLWGQVGARELSVCVLDLNLDIVSQGADQVVASEDVGPKDS